MILAGDWTSVSWSPDGQRLVITGYADKREAENPQADAYTVAPDGSAVTKLTDDAPYEHWAAWSPDGATIAYVVSEGYDDVDYRSDVFVADADGSNAHRVTTWAGFDSFPVWSPDGEWLAFASDRDATLEQQRANRDDQAFAWISTYVMRPDGSDLRPMLISRAGETILPSSWVPSSTA